jgi:hypothetical protein
MGREEEHNIATLLFWEFLESSFDILGDSLGCRHISGRKGWGDTDAHLNETGMRTPTINDAPINTRK